MVQELPGQEKGRYEAQDSCPAKLLRPSLQVSVFFTIHTLETIDVESVARMSEFDLAAPPKV